MTAKWPMRRDVAGHAALLVLGLVTLASTVVAVRLNFSPLPFADSWDGTIGFYMRALQSPWHAFFEQHNEHRLTFSRFIFFADVRYFGGRNVLSLIANLVLAGALAAAFFRIALRYTPSLSCAERFGLAGVVMVFTFSWAQEDNFTWGFQSQWFAVYLFALLAFHSLDLCATAHVRKAPGNSFAWLITSLGCGWLAAYSMSSGVLVLPILIVQALYLRLRLRDLLIIVAVTAATWFAYFVDWHAPMSSGNLRTSLLQQPFGSTHYVLLYLGGPARFARLGWIGTHVCGVVVAVALIINCIRALRSGAARARAVALLALAVFVAGNALLTAAGRLWFGLATALASRYTTASLAAWLALILFAGINAPSEAHRTRVIVIAVLATLLVASAQRFAFKRDDETIYERHVAGLALRAHVYDPSITQAVYPFPELLTNIAREAEAQKISLFAADQPDYLIAPPTIVTTSACNGHIDEITRTPTAGVYRATGWIYSPAAQRAPRNVVITDANGKTLGVGIAGGKNDDALEQLGRRAKLSGWTAFFTPLTTGIVLVAGQIGGNAYCGIPDARALPASVSGSG